MSSSDHSRGNGKDKGKDKIPDNGLDRFKSDSNLPSDSATGSIPIRLPRNSVQMRVGTPVYQEATQALNELPSSISSSVGRTGMSIWDPEYKRPSSQLDSSDRSILHQTDDESHPVPQPETSKAPAADATAAVPVKAKVTFKASNDNINSSDFAGSYDLGKNEAARLLKRHLVTKRSSPKARRLSSNSHNDNESDTRKHLHDDMSADSDNLPIEPRISYRKSALKKSKQKSQDATNALNENQDQDRTHKRKHFSVNNHASTSFHDSEEGEYDRLLGSQESDDDYDYDKEDSDFDENAPSSQRHPSKKTKNVLINPLTLQSGDITHSLYKWQQANAKDGRNSLLKRNLSYVAPKNVANGSDEDWGVPFAPSDITQPGGFRRYYMRERAIREGRSLPLAMTSNFVDFISLYGHFAGGNYPSDEDEAASDSEFDEDDERYLDMVNRERYRRASGQFGDSNSVYSTGENGTISDIPIIRHEGTASSKKAFFLLIKSFVGTGILFLPKSFYNGGLLFSIALMAVTAVFALHCMLLLIECHSKLRMSYGDIGYYLIGKKTRNLVFFSIVVSQIGFCCAYSIFVATNTKFLFNSITKCTMDLPLSFWILVQFVVYIPMSMVRRIKNFSVLALIADVFIVIGLAYLFYYDGHILATQGIAPIKMFNPVTFPLLIGTAVFSFEGIGLVIPVIDSMKHPADFPKVLSFTVFLSATLFIVAASLSYMAFGDKVETVILLNLTSGGATTSFIQFLYSLAILFSVPLQLFPAIRILESGLFTKSGKRNSMVKWQKNAFRLVLCLVIATVSIMVADQLDEFVSVIGTFACVPLSFIYPSLFHYLAIDSSRVVKIKNLFLFFSGILVMFYVTNLTLQQWGSSTPTPPQCPKI